MFSNEFLNKVIPLCKNKLKVWGHASSKGLLSGKYQSINDLRKTTQDWYLVKKLLSLL